MRASSRRGATRSVREIRTIFTAALPGVRTIVNEKAQLQSEIAALEKQRRLFGGLAPSAPRAIDCLRALTAAVPDDVTLNIEELSLDGETLRLRGLDQELRRRRGGEARPRRAPGVSERRGQGRAGVGRRAAGRLPSEPRRRRGAADMSMLTDAPAAARRAASSGCRRASGCSLGVGARAGRRRAGVGARGSPRRAADDAAGADRGERARRRRDGSAPRSLSRSCAPSATWCAGSSSAAAPTSRSSRTSKGVTRDTLSRERVAAMNPSTRTVAEDLQEEDVEMRLSGVSLRELVALLYRRREDRSARCS